ncbi:hypothetical protein OG946_25575 [Streptomyces sp. NBC_01808]|uniref:hypothetical protein n=1 Tax=Streptomyces sp. NBC_01808 TaxID=2975947 RepID=UPI002DD8DE26|nr:hypothetical protein [Streptomyces sp. NBC_01808]WSA40441.1 hypothetical protein OG946_25575 [Streptomyces sp. NBC_01808]
MEPIAAALAEEAARKSGLVWIEGPDGTQRALWHVWHDGAVVLVGDGPAEQPLDGLGLADGAVVTVHARSKDKGGRLVAWPARVAELAPESEAWRAAVEELKGKRLNAVDADHVAGRWARESRVLRLTRDGTAVAGDGLPSGSLAAPPPATPATTRRPAPAALPRLLFRRRRG